MQQVVSIFLSRGYHFKNRHIHKDPYEVLHIYEFRSVFFASNIGAMTCFDLAILYKYHSTGELVEFDEDDSPSGYIIGKSIEEICCELNSNYNYTKFVISNTSDGLTEITLPYYLITDNSYFSQKTKFDAYRVAADAFIDTIHKQYSMAISNNKVESDIEIEIDFPLNLNPIQFQFRTLTFKNKPTNYLAGRCENIYSKYGLLFFRKVNILLLAFFVKDIKLFEFAVSRHLNSYHFFEHIPNAHVNPIKFAIIQYAKSVDICEDDREWLTTNLYDNK